MGKIHPSAIIDSNAQIGKDVEIGAFTTIKDDVIIGDEVVAGMVRAAEGWKTNISVGGKPEKFELNGEVEALSVEANRAVGLEYSGVDIMSSEKDGAPYIIEVNSTPGWRGLQTVTENNIARQLVDFVYAKLTE